MGIDIEQIALNVDKGNLGNKNNAVLDTDNERLEFVKQAKEAGATEEEIRNYFQGQNITNEAIDKALGVQLSLTGRDVSADSAKFVESRSKADKKDDRKFALKELNAVGSNYAKAEPINWDALANDLTIRVQKQNPYIKQNLMTQIKTVINLFKNYKYDSKESIEKAYKAAKDSLPKGENKDFMEDVLKIVANIADAHQKEVEKGEVLKEYGELKEKGSNREDAVKALKQKFEPKKSFYSEVIKEVEENVIMKEAHDEVWDAINRQRIGQVGVDGNVVTADNALTDKTDIQKAIKKDPNLTRDRYTNKVMKGSSELSASEKINFERSTYKADRASAAADNRVAINREKPFTENNFKKELRHDQIFNVLVQKGWIEDTNQTTEDGKPTYTLKKLSDELGRKVGAETAGSPQKREYIAYSEMERILLSILAEGGEHTDVKMSKSDVIGLLKMCGYDYNGTTFIKKLWQETGGALADAVVGAATALAVGVSSTAEYAGNRGPFKVQLPYEDNVPVTVDVINNTHIKMSFTSNNQYASFNKLQFLKDLMRENGLTSDDVSLENIENGFSVIVNKNSANTVEFMKKVSGMAEGEVLPEDLGIDFDNIDKDTDKDYTKSLVVGLLLTLGLMALRAALRQSGELPIEITQFESKDFNKYKEELNTRVDRGTLKPDQRDALLQIAEAYVKDGNWDSERYKAMLNKIAGDGSFLNKFELAIGADKILRGIIKDEDPQITTTVTTTKKDNANAQEEYFYDITENKQEVTTKTDRFYGANMFSSWDPMTNLYPGLATQEGMTTSKASRMLKVMQGITDDNYDYDRLKRITDDSFKMPLAKFKEEYANVPGFDLAAFLSVYGASIAGDSTDTKPNENRPNGKEWWSILAPVEITRDGKTFIRKVEIEVPDPQRSAGRGKGTTSVHVEGGSKKTTTSETVNIYNNKGEKIATGGRELLNKYQGAKLKSS